MNPIKIVGIGGSQRIVRALRGWAVPLVLPIPQAQTEPLQ